VQSASTNPPRSSTAVPSSARHHFASTPNKRMQLTTLGFQRRVLEL
jgi:hypothetical protein